MHVQPQSRLSFDIKSIMGMSNNDSDRPTARSVIKETRNVFPGEQDRTRDILQSRKSKEIDLAKSYPYLTSRQRDMSSYSALSSYLSGGDGAKSGYPLTDSYLASAALQGYSANPTSYTWKELLALMNQPGIYPSAGYNGFGIGYRTPPTPNSHSSLADLNSSAQRCSLMHALDAPNSPLHSPLIGLSPFSGLLPPVFPSEFALASAQSHDRRRIRTTFTPQQLRALEERFKNNHYIVGDERKKLAEELGLNEAQVKIWFQNRRTKYKQEKEFERIGRNKSSRRKGEHHVRKWQIETGTTENQNVNIES